MPADTYIVFIHVDYTPTILTPNLRQAQRKPKQVRHSTSIVFYLGFGMMSFSSLEMIFIRKTDCLVIFITLLYF